MPIIIHKYLISRSNSPGGMRDDKLGDPRWQTGMGLLYILNPLCIGLVPSMTEPSGTIDVSRQVPSSWRETINLGEAGVTFNRYGIATKGGALACQDSPSCYRVSRPIKWEELRQVSLGTIWGHYNVGKSK